MKKTFKHSKFTATFTDEKGYFSFTGDVDGASGAVGDEIAAVYPDFKLLADTHLADYKTGAPMHAWKNAEYWAEKGDTEKLAKHLRCSVKKAAEYVVLLNDYLIEDNKLTERNLADFQTELEDAWLSQVDEVYELVEETPANLTNSFMNPLDTLGDPLPGYEEILGNFSEPEKAIAVAYFEDTDVSDVSDVSERYEIYSAGGNDYMILTDEEADEKWDEYLENYIDDCLEIPEPMARYFDREAWKRDARMDSRGHSLSSYDGEENEVRINGTTYFLYQQ